MLGESYEDSSVAATEMRMHRVSARDTSGETTDDEDGGARAGGVGVTDNSTGAPAARWAADDDTRGEGSEGGKTMDDATGAAEARGAAGGVDDVPRGVDAEGGGESTGGAALGGSRDATSSSVSTRRPVAGSGTTAPMRVRSCTRVGALRSDREGVTRDETKARPVRTASTTAVPQLGSSPATAAGVGKSRSKGHCAPSGRAGRT